ncbi:MAG: SRPBCC family protein, partial [Actinobacteria bacterium]|nr:SRPBCC family protein [Actinomycetota bacterium]
GEVKVWIRDMHPVYEDRRDEERIEYSPDEIVHRDSIVVGMPPGVLWDYLNQTDFRNILTGSDRFEVLNRKDGRVGLASVYQCYHGKQLVSQVVVEWRPFERLVLRTRMPLPGKPTYADLDCRLEPMPEGTRLTTVFARVSGPALKRMAANLMLKMMRKRNLRDLEAFRDAVEADFAEHQELRSEFAGPITAESISEAAAASLRS